jgi:hypothetical protein
MLVVGDAIILDTFGKAMVAEVLKENQTLPTFIRRP